MEMHQFIGDLITSGNASSSQTLKEQPDVIHAAWGLAAGEALGFKGASLDPVRPPRPPPDKADPASGRQTQPGQRAQGRAEVRDTREGEGSK